ncbi:hypothetical protein PDIG_67990 [Penicillium digitatum PHI26]|uniref:Uncharacterized protein n=2 Tax=Penicillium digitatum TaxID=36651 RepID=K9G5J3_PEND2|nr:hypothetical protein PDIP_77290 [Penicillium digitatum Pd1]EKV06693.1 hypothetical protein PDIP_77290 [Penicillium digitatum Pd1]EKV08466.1 hypothetical protein PDIG_67990 [Penicillium digitatum PHI26]
MADIRFRVLIGVPTEEIIIVCHGECWGLVVLVGCANAAGLSCFIVAKLFQKK